MATAIPHAFPSQTRWHTSASTMPCSKLLRRAADTRLACNIFAGGPDGMHGDGKVAALPGSNEPLPVPHKRCRHCGQVRPASAFQVDRHSSDELQSYCRECASRP